jgi:hypothetical protein
MGCFKPQPSSVELNAVTDDIHKTEPLPKKGLMNTLFKMVEVVDRCPGIKIGSLLGEEVTQSKGCIRFSTRRGDGLRTFWRGGSGLTAGQSIDLVIVTKDSDIRISAGGMEEVISPDARQVAVSGEDKDIKVFTNSLDGLRGGQHPTMRRMNRI